MCNDPLGIGGMLGHSPVGDPLGSLSPPGLAELLAPHIGGSMSGIQNTTPEQQAAIYYQGATNTLGPRPRTPEHLIPRNTTDPREDQASLGHSRPKHRNQRTL